MQVLLEDNKKSYTYMQVLLEDNKKEKDTTRQAIRPHRLLEIRIFFIILSRKQTSRKKNQTCKY